jgi:hypothetical protein
MMSKRCLFVLLILAAAAGLPAQTELFWEVPTLFSQSPGTFPISAFSKDFSVVAWQETQANRDPSIAADGFINIVLAVKKTGQEWEHLGVVGGP